MENSKLLEQINLFTEKDFFDAELCVQLRCVMRSALESGALVFKSGTYQVDKNSRKATLAGVSVDIATMVVNRLQGVMPKLQQHFGIDLTHCASPEFLIYREGDFFRPHQDTVSDRRVPPEVEERKISTIIFLNSQSERPTINSYDGGYLNFYNLASNPNWNTCRSRFVGNLGSLIAFPSQIFHEVTPITRGERYTIVTWFYTKHKSYFRC